MIGILLVFATLASSENMENFHPTQYATRDYSGDVSVQIGKSGSISFGSDAGLAINGLSATEPYKIVYRNKNRVIASFIFKYDDPNRPNQVIDQRAYNGNKSLFKRTVSIKN